MTKAAATLPGVQQKEGSYTILHFVCALRPLLYYHISTIQNPCVRVYVIMCVYACVSSRGVDSSHMTWTQVRNMITCNSTLTLTPMTCCHALAIVGFLFSILVRPGCDYGGHSMSFFLCFVFLCLGLVWFSIRDSCLSLSLIENHT